MFFFRVLEEIFLDDQNAYRNRQSGSSAVIVPEATHSSCQIMEEAGRMMDDMDIPS